MRASIGLGIVVLVASLSLLAPASEERESVQGKPLARAGLLALYHHWFQKPYEYMFDSGSLTVRGQTLGMLKAGINGILKYGALNDAAARYQREAEPGFGDLRPIQRLAGIKIFLRQDDRGTTFSRYNPTIIRWGYQNLIPEPTDKVAGIKCQTLYDGIFQRFFRLMADAHLYLDRGQLWGKERVAYQKAMKARKKLDGIDYLQQRYGNALSQYPLSQDGTTFTAPMGIGFWLRRKMDGTAAEVWTGLGKLMALYDASFWTARSKK